MLLFDIKGAGMKKCKECQYSMEHVFEGQYWCSLKMGACDGDSVICVPSYARKRAEQNNRKIQKKTS